MGASRKHWRLGPWAAFPSSGDSLSPPPETHGQSSRSQLFPSADSFLGSPHPGSSPASLLDRVLPLQVLQRPSPAKPPSPPVSVSHREPSPN
ncbi:unnamed protein product [Linum trigynum]|uniref:Uncharacterized protein n=1 Tax=Linum trigynum TaxID=586398 RepID=A0AAV2CCP3_9ROSI